MSPFEELRDTAALGESESPNPSSLNSRYHTFEGGGGLPRIQLFLQKLQDVLSRTGKRVHLVCPAL